MNGSGGGQRCAQFGICKGAPMFDRRGNKRERARERDFEGGGDVCFDVLSKT